MAKKEKKKKPFSLEEQIEWIAIAFVLALTVKCFIVEAYQIPTGSMAPTLYGKHYEITCKTCGARFNLRRDAGAAPALDFGCPVCSRQLSGGPDGPADISARGGDRILVSKNLYMIREPERWQVFVFKSPENGNENMNFVKRLVGLPGETLMLKNGQVFIDGHVSRKPEKIQNRLWQDVYNGLSARAAPDYWRPMGGWEVTPEGLLLAQSQPYPQTIQFDRTIVDSYDYNGGRGQNLVGDLMVSADVLIDNVSGEFVAAVWNDDDTYKAVFRPIGDKLAVELLFNERRVGDAMLRIPSAKRFTFSLSNVDGVVRVDVNDAEVASYRRDFTPDDVPLFTTGCGVFFQATGSMILLKDVGVKRDIYYRSDLARPDHSLRRPFVIDIPEGYFIGLGDNSPISRDSRQWGVVPRENVLGKAFFVFWPISRMGPVH